jgi:hypothetical protein
MHIYLVYLHVVPLVQSFVISNCITATVLKCIHSSRSIIHGSENEITHVERKKERKKGKMEKELKNNNKGGGGLLFT